MRPILERFWEKVNKNGPNGCWVWMAAKDPNGYGRFGTGPHQVMLSHRFSYILVNGSIDPGLVLDHICHNASCVNPNHLRMCSQAENTRGQKLSSSNKSGVKGVSWHAGAKRWRATITLNRKQEHLGFFDSKDEAHAAYRSASARLHGPFGNFGDAATEFGVTFTIRTEPERPPRQTNPNCAVFTKY